MKSDIEIARSIELKKIKQVAESIGIPREATNSLRTITVVIGIT